MAVNRMARVRKRDAKLRQKIAKAKKRREHEFAWEKQRRPAPRLGLSHSGTTNEKIECTPGHPFWVIEGEDLDSRPMPEHIQAAVIKGSAVPGRWVDAGDLRVGDVLLTQSGERKPVTALVRRPYQGKVYNFAVEGLHNYAVGTSSILVHNNCSAGGLGNVGSHAPVNVDVALSAGERFLGQGAREIAPGVFRSADGLRQFRMTVRDLLPTHGNIGPHVHFEALNSLGQVIENLHLPFFIP